MSSRTLPASSSTDQDRPSRSVLVIGSTIHPKNVTAYAWDELPGYLNFADFDVVVINLAALSELDDGAVVENVPDLSDVGRVLFSDQTETIVVRGFGEHDSVSDWFWSAIRLADVYKPGRVVQDVRSGWSWYFDRLSAYAHYFTGSFSSIWPAESYFRALSIAADQYGLAMAPMASSRDGRPIAVAMELIAREDRDYQGYLDVKRSSPIFVLPTIYGVPAGEVVNLILQHRYGFEITTKAPEWSGAYVLMSHAPVLGELGTLREAIADAEARLPDLIKREEYAARFQGLLYEGDDALEPLVREALTILGGRVAEPIKKGIEDGRVTDPDGNLYMIEIKGLTREVKRAHVRQLQDWVTAAQTDEDLDCRGLLVANVYRTQAPGERAAPITGEVVKAVRRVSHAVITTTQLFQALADLEAGTLTSEIFWKAIADAEGLVDLPELRPPPEDAVPE